MTKVASTIAVLAALAAFAPAGAQATVYIASNPRGDQVLSQHVLFQQSNRPGYVATRQRGSRFGPLTPITPSDASYGAAVFVDDAGGALALATGYVFTDRYLSGFGSSLLLARPPGGDFTQVADLSSDSEPGGPTFAAGANGDAIFAWQQYGQPAHYRFRPAGGELGPDTPLPGNDPGQRAMSVERDGTVVYLWAERAHTFEAERPPGGQFGAPTEVAGVAPYAEWTLASSRNGRMLLLWGDNGAITGVERPPHGHFGSPFKLPIPGGFFNIHSASIADSGAAAVTAGYTTDYLVARDPGGKFRKAVSFRTHKEGLTSPTAAVDERGDVALAWFDHVRRVFGSYRPAGGRPQKSRLIAPRPPLTLRQDDRPGLAITSAGRATVAWEASDGAKVRTLARDFSRTKTYRRQRVGVLPSFVREGPPEACRPTGEPIVLSSRQATVFGTDAGGLHACLLARGAPVPLVTAVEESVQSAETIALAGPFVAYATDYRGHSQFTTSIVVTDLRDPDSGVNRSADPEGFDHDATVLATRLKANGAVAFMDSVRDDPGARESRNTTHVFAWDLGAATPRPLDSGHRIDPGSLRLNGSELTWRKRGKLHHATLR